MSLSKLLKNTPFCVDASASIAGRAADKTKQKAKE